MYILSIVTAQQFLSMKGLAFVILFLCACSVPERADISQIGYSQQNGYVVAAYHTTLLDSAQILKFTKEEFPKALYGDGSIYFYNDSVKPGIRLFSVDTPTKKANELVELAGWDAYVAITKNGMILTWPMKR